jgi:hypothetical protein
MAMLIKERWCSFSNNRRLWVKSASRYADIRAEALDRFPHEFFRLKPLTAGRASAYHLSILYGRYTKQQACRANMVILRSYDLARQMALAAAAANPV